MLALLLLPAGLQMLAMFVDEVVCHRLRGLPTWERLGHPVDTLITAACYAWLVITPATTPHALWTYAALGALSCLVITKDEFVHARLCGATEHWLHACLFVLHPIVLGAFAVIWSGGLAPLAIRAELAGTLALFVYQLVYWSPLWQNRHQHSQA